MHIYSHRLALKYQLETVLMEDFIASFHLFVSSSFWPAQQDLLWLPGIAYGCCAIVPIPNAFHPPPLPANHEWDYMSTLHPLLVARPVSYENSGEAVSVAGVCPASALGQH